MVEESQSSPYAICALKAWPRDIAKSAHIKWCTDLWPIVSWLNSVAAAYEASLSFSRLFVTSMLLGISYRASLVHTRLRVS